MYCRSKDEKGTIAVCVATVLKSIVTCVALTKKSLFDSILLTKPQNNIVYVPAWASGSEQNNLVFPMLGVTGTRPRFRNPEKFRKGRLQMFRTTRSNEFSRCWVMVSWGVLVQKN